MLMRAVHDLYTHCKKPGVLASNGDNAARPGVDATSGIVDCATGSASGDGIIFEAAFLFDVLESIEVAFGIGCRNDTHSVHAQDRFRAVAMLAGDSCLSQKEVY
jgi:hypothetical protein